MRISDWSSDVCSSDLASARARLSIRFNDQHKGADLVAMIERIAHEVEPNAKILGKISGEAFLTPPGELSELVADAIHAETDVRPELSTTGGTSDARFLHALCPVVEFGSSEERRVGQGLCAKFSSGWWTLH